jgi:hypothetical protein
MARKLMSAPRLDDAMGDRTNHLADQLGYVRRRPCLSKQSQGDRRGVDHTDPPLLSQRYEDRCRPTSEG